MCSNENDEFLVGHNGLYYVLYINIYKVMHKYILIPYMYTCIPITCSIMYNCKLMRRKVMYRATNENQTMKGPSPILKAEF